MTNKEWLLSLTRETQQDVLTTLIIWLNQEREEGFR